MIRPATEHDLAELLAMVRELAAFESLSDQCVCTEEDLRKDWRKDAEKRSALQMIFNKIAFAEKLLPEEKEIDTELKHMLEHYKDADPERLSAYVETMLANENVFRFLENAETSKQ